MLNANENKTHTVKLERTIAKPAADVFRAIGEGRIFLNCSAHQESMSVDFRVGGRYALEFRAFGVFNGGEFLEIVPNEKIVFTWSQDGEKNAKGDTTVTILLREEKGKTHLTLIHEGFRDEETRADHEQGWTNGFDDLTAEMTEGRLRFHRWFRVPVQRLYEACSNPASFFGQFADLSKGSVDFRVGGKYQAPTKRGKIEGEFLEIVPNEKIVFSWLSANGERLPHPTKVTLKFEADEDTSWLELIHEGLDTEALQKAHRAGWDGLITRLMS